jgi:hypothetical protein
MQFINLSLMILASIFACAISLINDSMLSLLFFNTCITTLVFLLAFSELILFAVIILIIHLSAMTIFSIFLIIVTDTKQIFGNEIAHNIILINLFIGFFLLNIIIYFLITSGFSFEYTILPCVSDSSLSLIHNETLLIDLGICLIRYSKLAVLGVSYLFIILIIFLTGLHTRRIHY